MPVVPESLPDRITRAEVVALLGCCSGKINKFVWLGKLPAPGPDGLFSKAEFFGSIAWRERGRT